MKKLPDKAHKLAATPLAVDFSDDALPTEHFDDREFDIARHIASARMLTYSDGSQTTHGEQSDYSAHLTGVMGEMAVRRVLNHPNEEVIRLYGDPGYDLTIEESTADVKTTAADVDRPDLIVAAQQSLPADLYVLVHRFEQRTLRVVGYATRETVRSREPERFPGDDLNYVVSPDELRVLA